MMTFEEFESILNKAVKSSYGKLHIPGYSRENDPVYALTLTDFSVPADEKFNMFAKSLGFTGKASISPRHVEVINEVFSPTIAEIDYAYEVIDAINLAKAQGKGAISLRGKMIDAPIVARAERTIAMARALGLSREEE